MRDTSAAAGAPGGRGSWRSGDATTRAEPAAHPGAHPARGRVPSRRVWMCALSIVFEFARARTSTDTSTPTSVVTVDSCNMYTGLGSFQPIRSCKV